MVEWHDFGLDNVIKLIVVCIPLYGKEERSHSHQNNSHNQVLALHRDNKEIT